MKKKLPLIVLHRFFSAGVLLILVGFCAFLGYVYVIFNGPLTGDIRTETTPELLTHLQTKKLETLVGWLEKRRSLPDVSPALPDPFDGAPHP